jgi:hypothetical protein
VQYVGKDFTAYRLYSINQGVIPTTNQNILQSK